mgnify:CR=1 FL=1
MPAKIFHPIFKGIGPFVPVLFADIASIKIERKLVIAIKFKSENACQGQVEIFQMAKIMTCMRVDPFSHLILNSQGIVTKKVFNLYEVDKILKQSLLQGKLHLFEDIIFIAWKKLSKHSIEGFGKNSDKE